MIDYTFIIPHHNSPELLNRLLDTIPQRKDIEIIVVDDNRDVDKKPQVSRDDVNVILLSKEKSKGAGYARNVGLDMAKGKWLMFADGDDYYVDNFIEDLDCYKNSEYDIIYFDAYLNYTLGDELCKYEKGFIHNCIINYENSAKTTYDKNLFVLSSNTPWCKMMRREFVLSTKCRYEEIPISNDASFILNVGVKANIIKTVNKKIYFYMLNPQGITYVKRPLNHYYLALKSSIRLNVLKNSCGCWKLIKYPGFHVENILRDHGRLACCRLFLYRLLHDPTMVSVAIKKMWVYIRK